MLYSPKINDAIRVAASAHEGQYRKGSSTPFIVHPIAVALITQKYIDDEDTYVAALLQDVLEDVPERTYSRTDMLHDFGADIVGIVEDVTEPDITEPTKEAWRERKQGYIDHLAEISDIRPLIISCADKIHNMSEIIREHKNTGGEIWKAFHVGRSHEIWFYETVLAVLRQKVLPPEAIEEYTSILTELKKLR